MAQENGALIRRWFEEVWNNGRMETIDEMASPDVVGHGQAQHDTVIGREQVQGFRHRIPPCISGSQSKNRPYR